MELRTKIIAAAVQRIIGQLSFDTLTAIHEAQAFEVHARDQSTSAQVRSRNAASTLTRELIEQLSEYQLDQIEAQLKLASRDLLKYTP